MEVEKKLNTLGGNGPEGSERPCVAHPRHSEHEPSRSRRLKSYAGDPLASRRVGRRCRADAASRPRCCAGLSTVCLAIRPTAGASELTCCAGGGGLPLKSCSFETQFELRRPSSHEELVLGSQPKLDGQPSGAIPLDRRTHSRLHNVSNTLAGPDLTLKHGGVEDAATETARAVDRVEERAKVLEVRQGRVLSFP